MRFTQEDLKSIEQKGINENKVEEQLEIFKRGNLPVDIVAAATPENGIRRFTPEERQELEKFYDYRKNELSIIKFIPASGAATRMFKALHGFLAEFDHEKTKLSQYIGEKEDKGLKDFFDHLEKLPFYESALNFAREYQPGFEGLTEDAQKYILVQTILFSPGLDLSNFPKGLVPFHNYGDYVATAFEEHLYEAAEYASSGDTAKLHFTVSEDHIGKFRSELEAIRSRVEERTNTTFEISFSYQDPSTDTLAVDQNNEPFRTTEGELFFRPGGHGALIQNLNKVDADLIFIKNIDNVVTLDKASEIGSYKKMLAGKLLKLQEKSFEYLGLLENGSPDKALLNEIGNFIKEELNIHLEAGAVDQPFDERITQYKDRLNRPLRVCGMVKNEGEPGGGPFLVRLEDGSSTLQIVESAQIDENNPQQKELAKNATHFNPVDIVAATKDHNGKKFDLSKYVDPSTSFIAEKSDNGRPLRALELPGLWNGGMAYWNTVFIEVPVTTFNPVKTILDLLKPTHQPG